MHILKCEDTWKKRLSQGVRTLSFGGEKKLKHISTAEQSGKRYLGTVATSVPAERLFSKARETISQRRNRFKAENVDMILFLNSNLKLK